MWIKLDDGFATHPKIITAGHEALAVQIRAICYASQNGTDGFLPIRSIPLFLEGVSRDINWREHMVKHGLWDETPPGYTIHDFLEWNCSQKEYVKRQKKLSHAGKKGMKSRWSKHYPIITNLITGVISDPVTSPSISISSSSLLPKGEKIVKKRGNGAREIQETDAPTEKHREFARTLGIDLGPEWGKFKNYCKAHGKKYCDFEAAFRNWLANAQAMQGGKR